MARLVLHSGNQCRFSWRSGRNVGGEAPLTLILSPLRAGRGENREEELAQAGHEYEESPTESEKRRELVPHVTAHGCALVREGSDHSG